jgi:anti-sigma factor RsiW
MSTERTPLSDRDLWRRLATDPIGRSAISEIDFAAWLEGRLSEAEAAHVDAAVTSDPELRRAALELSDILGKPLPAPPPRMAVRAQALVGFEAENKSSGRSWLAGLLPSFGQGFGLQRGAMAGMAVVVAAVGFMLGGGLGESYAAEKHAMRESTTGGTATRPLGRDTTNELNDLFVDAT